MRMCQEYVQQINKTSKTKHLPRVKHENHSQDQERAYCSYNLKQMLIKQVGVAATVSGVQ